jgi:aminopeptidase
MDARISALARNLFDHSLALKRGDRVLIEGEAGCEPLVRGLIKEAYERGAEPFFEVVDPVLRRAQLLGANRGQLDVEASWRLTRIKSMDARVFILAGSNHFELADVPAKALQDWSLATKPMFDEIMKKRWVLLRFPTASGAQGANMSSEAFEDFCFRVSTLDYSVLDRAMDPLVDLMAATDMVRIVGPGTDLSFSIKDIPVVKCAGTLNVPDGEVFTAPVKDSVDGTITFNTSSVMDGVSCERVGLTFRDGKVVEETGDPLDRITSILDTDEGARYVGEFALGVNPHITVPMKDILYDEKIAGSLHFTPGEAYEDADNGNKSAVHWDLVLIQTAEWGGGEIWFDGRLVRKDGLFVLPELEPLNPAKLLEAGIG